MTTSPCPSNFSHQHYPHPDHSPNPAQTFELSRDLDVIKRDRFELLSAYLDGEVTPHERQLVNSWLAHDPSAKRLYNRLLNLRQGFRSGPVEPAATPDETLEGVFNGLNRRFRTTCMAGAGVLAIGALGLLSGVFRPQQFWMQQAATPSNGWETGEVLQIALDEPAFPIPQASVSDLAVPGYDRRPALPTDPEL